jgi:zinc/manganese transport system ATP-binding protein
LQSRGAGCLTPPRLGRQRIAYLPQQAEIDRAFPITVADTVSLGLWNEIGVFGALTGPLRERTAAALAAVGLEGVTRRSVGALSAGQLQRVLFARLLLQDAPVILLDEPFAAIDERTTADLLVLIHRWHEERRTVIAVLHDIELVRRNFPMTLLLARELVDWGPTHQALTSEALQRARRMAQSWSDGNSGAALPERDSAWHQVGA